MSPRRSRFARLLAPEKSRTRIALSGAGLSALFLLLLALGTRSIVRSTTFADIDEELYTLAAAVGSSFELEGLEEARRDTLRAGLEANAFEFRLANHSAILFKGDAPVALSGNLLGASPRVDLSPYRDKPETPYTAIEPYSGQGRVCRFLVTRLSGRAGGATLVLFRWIGPTLASLRRIDRALLGIVLFGFLGTAAILAYAVTRAIRPVEEVTRLAEELEATDLSRRVRIDSGGEEFRRLSAVINSLVERLERAFRAQRRLIADAAHELKTPSAILVGEAQDGLRPDARPEDIRASLETIERVARGLAREVDALLQLARGDAGAPERRKRVDLARIAEQAVGANEAAAAGRGVRCRIIAASPATVSGDRAGIFRVASNLVANAVLYTAPGTEIEVETGASDGNAYLEVRDRGPGIPPEQRRAVFERFVRLEEGRSANPEGSGLGLAIVEQVTQAHGGAVVVSDRPGGGAVFRVSLPAAPAGAKAAAKAEASGPRPPEEPTGEAARSENGRRGESGESAGR